MLPVLPGLEIAEAAVDWAQAWRIIASRFPPIHLFERVSPNPAVWEALIELEELTNPRVRDQVGQISHRDRIVADEGRHDVSRKFKVVRGYFRGHRIRLC